MLILEGGNVALRGIPLRHKIFSKVAVVFLKTFASHPFPTFENTQVFTHLCARRAVLGSTNPRPPIVVSLFEARQRQPNGSSLQVHEPDVRFGCDNA